MTDAPALVDSPDAITPAWLTAALRSAGHELTVDSVSFAPVGTGQMSTCFRLEVGYADGDGPGSFVVKLPSFDRDARTNAAMSNATEVSFYRELANELTVDAPHCYFGAFSDGGANFVMLLEDLAPAEQGDQIAGCSVEQARAAVVNLAGLHGPRWCEASLPDLPFLNPMTSVEAANGTGAILQQMTPQFVARYDVGAADTEVLDAFAAGAPRWLRGRRDRFGLVHGDYRLDNLMFATPRGGRPCTAVDWQLLSIGLPARDVGFFLSTGLSAELRAAHERDLVDDYHRALVAAGVQGYSAAECWDDYRYALFQATMITVLGAMFAPRTDRGDVMFQVMTARSCAAIRDLDALALL